MFTPATALYESILLPINPAPESLRSLVEPYQALIVTQLRAILDRTERSKYYPWIDTKINLVTGEELPEADPLLGRDVISGWVQGRGLETMTKLAAWLAPFGGDAEVDGLIERARRLVGDLLARLGQARTVNGGHLYFFMEPTGEAFVLGPDARRIPLTLDAESPHGYSDLFCAKGMYAAAHLFEDADGIAEARGFCRAVYRDVLSRSFRSDQPQPAFGARAWIGGAFSHGPAMISLGISALFAQFEPGPEAAETGLTLARSVLENHVNLQGRLPGLHDYDLVEFVDEAGKPWADEAGRIVSDPGHSLEFVGLFLKFSHAIGRFGGATTGQLDELRSMERLMPSLLIRAFENGYQQGVGGICKTIDLLSRRPVDDTMPWWSLPETIRAALAALRVAESDEHRRRCLRILALSHNAFVAHYVRPEVHLMAVKLRDARGDTPDLIPAYPDADPGYHTCLSLIDALELMDA
jgi:hypothetical protein